MSLRGKSLLTEMDTGVAEASAGGFLAQKRISLNNFPSWSWSKMVYIKPRRLVGSHSFGFHAGYSFNVVAVW